MKHLYKKFLILSIILFAVSLCSSVFLLFYPESRLISTYIIDIFLKVLALSMIFVLVHHIKFYEYPRQEKNEPVQSAPPVSEPAAPVSAVPKCTFADVAGLDEVKDELQEIVHFLKSPKVYQDMGASLPKGILFYGPPGTGKTLLARALSGECDALFHYVCGSEFVEKYVGVGAKRVRILFEKAKRQTPSIIFIDEIDAVGAKRSSESNNEKEQTLNQLLVELDGFASNHSVVVIGATNRLDLLDEALLRPGRFDRQIYIGSPDVSVREQILTVHFQNKPLDQNLSMEYIAKQTAGMTGAHLANIANEAAILAVRFQKSRIGVFEVDQAIEKSLAGLERKNAVISDTEKKKIACHEAGHALLAKLFTHDSVAKISIIPRGTALGYTMQVPEENRLLVTKDELLARIKVLLGGRAAEMLVFGELSSGARDDLKKANEIAREMVCSLGMSRFGNVIYDEWHAKSCYPKISTEIKQITDYCYREACVMMTKHQDQLHALAETLLQRETLCESEIDDILSRHQSTGESASVASF